MMTLKELCNELGITRRTVQGYEAAGLLRATCKNGRGYLLYDDYAVERIKRIVFFHKVGFTRKEIKTFIDAPNEKIKKVLSMRIQELIGEKEHIEDLIVEIEMYIMNL